MNQKRRAHPLVILPKAETIKLIGITLDGITRQSIVIGHPLPEKTRQHSEPIRTINRFDLTRVAHN